MHLGFDIDGVISDFVKTFIEIVKRKYGVVLKRTDVYCHDLNLVLGITKKDGNQLIRCTLGEDLPVNNGAKEAMERLREEGHKIFIITARPSNSIEMTKTWLRHKGLPYTQLVQLNEGKKYLAKVKLDLIVDDNLEDALEWSQRTENVLVYDQPWNQTLNLKNLVKRVHGWNEILDEVQRLQLRQP